jgi:hypothetical protein
MKNYEREFVVRRLRAPGPLPHEVVAWKADHKRARKAAKLIRDTRRTEDGRRKGAGQ